MWDTKYRPLRFADVIGQKGIVEILKARLRKGEALNASYIFAGGHGQGKTTLARILAKAVLCQNLQDDQEPCNECDNCTAIQDEVSVAFQELDAASRGTIENVRGIVDDLAFVVPGAPKRIILFDEMHRMSSNSQDVLLKPIEDKKMVGIFCTTERNKIRPTILSRCEIHDVRKVTRDDIYKRMEHILGLEKVEFEEDALWTIIDYSGSHVRDVIKRLEMVAQLGPVTVEAVRSYLNLGVISTYYEILLALGDAKSALALADDACDRVGADEVFAGLGEAAMNSYRLAHGLVVDFLYVDKGLAKQVHERYGDAIVDLARHFVSSRTKGKVGVLAEIVSLVDSTGAVVQRPVDAAPQKLVISPTSAPPSPAPVPPAAAAPEEPKAAVEPPKVEPPKVEPPKVPTDSNMRSDGVGNLGSSDQQALGEHDTQGVARGLPRGANRDSKKGPGAVRGGKADKELSPLTPDEWKREFERTWTHRYG